MFKGIRSIQLVRCERLSIGACETAHLIKPTFQASQTPWRSRDKNWTGCLVLFATEVRELYKQDATRKNVLGKAKVERRNISTSTLLCLAVALPPSTKFSYLQHSDAYGRRNRMLHEDGNATTATLLAPQTLRKVLRTYRANYLVAAVLQSTTRCTVLTIHLVSLPLHVSVTYFNAFVEKVHKSWT